MSFKRPGGGFFGKFKKNKADGGPSGQALNELKAALEGALPSGDGWVDSDEELEARDGKGKLQELDFDPSDDDSDGPEEPTFNLPRGPAQTAKAPGSKIAGVRRDDMQFPSLGNSVGQTETVAPNTGAADTSFAADNQFSALQAEEEKEPKAAGAAWGGAGVVRKSKGPKGNPWGAVKSVKPKIDLRNPSKDDTAAPAIAAAAAAPAPAAAAPKGAGKMSIADMMKQTKPAAPASAPAPSAGGAKRSGGAGGGLSDAQRACRAAGLKEGSGAQLSADACATETAAIAKELSEGEDVASAVERVAGLHTMPENRAAVVGDVFASADSWSETYAKKVVAVFLRKLLEEKVIDRRMMTEAVAAGFDRVPPSAADASLVEALRPISRRGVLDQCPLPRAVAEALGIASPGVAAAAPAPAPTPAPAARGAAGPSATRGASIAEMMRGGRSKPSAPAPAPTPAPAPAPAPAAAPAAGDDEDDLAGMFQTVSKKSKKKKKKGAMKL